MSDEATLFVEEDMERTRVADTPAPKRRGRPPGRKTQVNPPNATPPGNRSQPQQTPAQIEAAKRTKIKKRETDVKKAIEDVVNPLLLQGAAMIVPPQFLFQVEATPDQTGIQIVTKDGKPVPTQWGETFYINQLEATIAAMTIARLEDIPAGGAIARLAEQALPYALCGGLLLAAGMYGRRVIGTIGQLRAAQQPSVVVVEEPSGQNTAPAE